MTNFGSQVNLVTGSGERPEGLDLGGLPGLEASELPRTAWAVWMVALEQARKESPVVQPHGYRWEGSLEDLITSIWELLPGAGAEAVTHATTEIGNYLRWSKNMVPQTASGGHLAWLVRATWNPDPPVRPEPRPLRATVRPASRPAPAAPAPPAPAPEPATVVLSRPKRGSFKCSWPSCLEPPFDDEHQLVHHHFRSHKSAAVYAKGALQRLDRPSRIVDIQAEAEHAGYPGNIDQLRRTLNRLEAIREVTTSLDASGVNLYALTPPVMLKALAARASAGRYACREPGCTAPPFTQADERFRHEKDFHPDMSSRPWPCLVDGCMDRITGQPERHYTQLSLAIHVSSGHKISRGTSEYARLMAEAKSASQEWERQQRMAARAAESEDEDGPVRDTTEGPAVLLADDVRREEVRAAVQAIHEAEIPARPEIGQPEPMQGAVAWLIGVVEENTELKAQVGRLRAQVGRLQEIIRSFGSEGE